MATPQTRENYLGPYIRGEKAYAWDSGELYKTKGTEAFLDEHLKKELFLYGEAAQATYDTVDLQPWSRFRDENRYAPSNLLDKKHLLGTSHFAELPYADYTAAITIGAKTEASKEDQHANGITATNNNAESKASKEDRHVTYLHASEKSDIIRSVVRRLPGQKVPEASVWIGYVAYSKERQDILVSWRGTQQPHEWLMDGKLTQVPYKAYKGDKSEVDSPLATRRSWNPVPLLWKACKKLYFGTLAGGFAVISTALTPALGLLNVLTSAPQDPSESPSFWGSIKAHIRAVPTILIRLGIAVVGVVVLALLRKAFPSTLDLLAFLLTLSFAAIGAIPFVHVVLPHIPGVRRIASAIADALRKPGDDFSLPYKIYVVVFAIIDLGLHVLASCYLHGFWANPLVVSSIVFAVSGLAPLFLAAAIRAGAQAGEKDEEGKVQIWIHEGFNELYTKPLKEHGDNKSDHVAAKWAPSQGTDGIEEKLLSKGDPEDPQDLDEEERRKTASPQTTLHARIKHLMAHHDVSTISVTGHSLGGALAVLSSFDLVKSGCNVKVDSATGAKTYVPVTCYSFEGPRVGNLAFAAEYDRLKSQGLTAIRIVNKPDIVPDVPRAFYIQNVYYGLGALLNQGDTIGAAVDFVEWLGYKARFPTCFQHVGAEITVDSRQVKWLKKMEGVNPVSNSAFIGVYHNLELVLHVLSGYNAPDAAKYPGFGGRFTRDFALANKGGDNVNPRFGIAPNWISTLVPCVVAAKYGTGYLAQPESAKPTEALADDKLKEWAHRSQAHRYGPDTRPALIQPYDATESEPNSGGDEARVIGQGPQLDEDGYLILSGDTKKDGHPNFDGARKGDLPYNQWLEDIHAWSQADFDKLYGLKTPVEEKDGFRKNRGGSRD